VRVLDYCHKLKHVLLLLKARLASVWRWDDSAVAQPS